MSIYAFIIALVVVSVFSSIDKQKAIKKLKAEHRAYILKLEDQHHQELKDLSGFWGKGGYIVKIAAAESLSQKLKSENDALLSINDRLREDLKECYLTMDKLIQQIKEAKDGE